MGEITRKKKKINWFMVMLLVPALAMLTVTIIIPVFVVVGMSFFHYNLLDMSNIKWNNFSNYKAVLPTRSLSGPSGERWSMCAGLSSPSFL